MWIARNRDMKMKTLFLLDCFNLHTRVTLYIIIYNSRILPVKRQPMTAELLRASNLFAVTNPRDGVLVRRRCVLNALAQDDKTEAVESPTVDLSCWTWALLEGPSSIWPLFLSLFQHQYASKNFNIIITKELNLTPLVKRPLLAHK